jgi:hypothetical protein
MQQQGAPGGAAGHERQAGQSQREPSAQSKDMQKDKGQQTQRDKRGKDQTTGQGAREQNQRQPGQEPGQAPNQRPAMQRDQNAPGQGAQGQQAGGSATLTTEQRTKIRETVLVGGNVPRATNVNFSISATCTSS